jgi:hypothetical protein
MGRSNEMSGKVSVVEESQTTYLQVSVNDIFSM